MSARMAVVTLAKRREVKLEDLPARGFAVLSEILVVVLVWVRSVLVSGVGRKKSMREKRWAGGQAQLLVE
jgi:hypothetical protein